MTMHDVVGQDGSLVVIKFEVVVDEAILNGLDVVGDDVRFVDDIFDSVVDEFVVVGEDFLSGVNDVADVSFFVEECDDVVEEIDKCVGEVDGACDDVGFFVESKISIKTDDPDRGHHTYGSQLLVSSIAFP